MDAEHPSVNDRTKGKVVEDLAAPPPNVAAPIFPLTLVIKSIHLGDLAGFMIASDEGDSLRISDLQRQQQEECFYAIESAVDKIP